MKTILCISHVFPPKINPLANRVKKLLDQFKKDYKVIALTSTKNAYLDKDTQIKVVRDIYPQKIVNLISKLKLNKFLELFIWPDKAIFWTLPALLNGYQLVKQYKPHVILTFMMPYSSSFIGIILKWLTGIPLVLTLDDSISCTDMHSTSPSLIHHHLDLCLEKFYINHADAIVYVSQINLDLAKNNQSISQQSKFHLIRCGAEMIDELRIDEESKNELFNNEKFEIIYTGGMNGWPWFLKSFQESEVSFLKKMYGFWMNLGRYKRVQINYQTSSPIFIGKAVQQLIEQKPDLKDKIHIKIYGNQFPESLVQEVLKSQGLESIVSVFAPIPHSEVMRISKTADLLFITLPDRPDGSEGGRISCKTYEYLTTNIPILAAVPKGENWNYLQDKIGTWLVHPTDVATMTKVIDYIVSAKLSGTALRYDRSYLQQELSYVNLAKEYLRIFEKVYSNIP